MISEERLKEEIEGFRVVRSMLMNNEEVDEKTKRYGEIIFNNILSTLEWVYNYKETEDENGNSNKTNNSRIINLVNLLNEKT